MEDFKGYFGKVTTTTRKTGSGFVVFAVGVVQRA